jgi:hypothetical protein
VTVTCAKLLHSVPGVGVQPVMDAWLGFNASDSPAQLATCYPSAFDKNLTSGMSAHVTAAPGINTTLWQAINSTATQPSSSGPITVTLLFNTSVTSGVPGSPAPPPPAPVDRASLPFNGTWSDFYSASGPAGAITKLPPPPGQQAQLPLSRSLVIKGGAINASTTVLDLAALHSLYVLPSGRNSSSQNANLTPVTLTFSSLTLVNAPPGPPSSYPLGMSTLMMWSVDMDR